MPISEMMIRGTIRPMLLAMLKGRAMYGYEIIKQVNLRTDGVLQWKEGTVYPVLHKLLAEGLLKAAWRAAEGGETPGRKRKYYQLTRKGRAELARQTEQWREFSGAVDAVMLEWA